MHGVVAVRAVARAQVQVLQVGTESVIGTRARYRGAGAGRPSDLETWYATFAESTKIAADVASFTARDSLRRRGAIANAGAIRASRKKIVDPTRGSINKLPLRSRKRERFRPARRASARAP